MFKVLRQGNNYIYQLLFRFGHFLKPNILYSSILKVRIYYVPFVFSERKKDILGFGLEVGRKQIFWHHFSPFSDILKPQILVDYRGNINHFKPQSNCPVKSENESWGRRATRPLEDFSRVSFFCIFSSLNIVVGEDKDAAEWIPLSAAHRQNSLVQSAPVWQIAFIHISSCFRRNLRAPPDLGLTRELNPAPITTRSKASTFKTSLK